MISAQSLRDIGVARRRPENETSSAADRRRTQVVSLAADGAHRRVLAHRSAFRRRRPAGARRAGLRRPLMTAAIAAELKAVFGDTAYLCAHIDDQGAPSPHAPWPLLRSVSALPVRRAGRGVRPARRPGPAGTAQRRLATRSAPRLISGAFRLPRSNPTAPARRPSQSDDYSPRRAFRRARLRSFRLEVSLPCRLSKSVRPRPRSRAQSRSCGSRPPTLTPFAAPASSRPRSPSTIQAF